MSTKIYFNCKETNFDGWNNQVAKKYDIRALPANFLIAPDGKILAIDIHGAELEKKLAEIFPMK